MHEALQRTKKKLELDTYNIREAFVYKQANVQEALVAFLCLELHCLPSQLENEDYNSIMNIKAALDAKAELSQKQARRK